MIRKMERPELLSPAGSWDSMYAAVNAGADAVYFGLSGFNARLRADNFTTENISDIMAYLRSHGVKGYVTLNVLIFTGEFSEAIRLLQLCDENSVDGVILQDVGLASISKSLFPGLPVHASTQMTITSAEGISFAEDLGVDLVVLARELSLRELQKLVKDAPARLPLEVFVHGALCVAYSGQCLTSESLGQRSANRGECAQACRLPYQLIVDDVVRELGDRRYLLSPQDLASVSEIPELVRLGVHSLKIEGRLKSPEYVAAVTEVYRKAVDRSCEGMDSIVDEGDQYKLTMSFSRGFHSGWLNGVNHQKLVHARYGKKRGAFLGRVKEVGSDFVKVSLEEEVKPGDGVCVDTGGDPDREQGGRVYEVKGNRLYFRNQSIDFRKVPVGSRVWKTHDPQLEKELRRYTAKGEHVRPRLPLHIEVSGQVGEALIVRVACRGVEVSGASESMLQMADSTPLTGERVRQQLSRLGGTPYFIGSFDYRVDETAILPVRELNQLRRSLVNELTEKRHSVKEPSAPHSFCFPKLEKPSALRIPEMAVLCRTMDQLHAALDEGVGRVYVDFEDIRRYRDAVACVREKGVEVFLATPRIQKQGEEGFFKLICSFEPDGVLVRNLGGVQWFGEAKSKLRLVGDFSLNVANPATWRVFHEKGLDYQAISYDLNVEQVEDFAACVDCEGLELTIHQHMPMFHMEHCVFAAFLSEGTDHTNCGRPCEAHRVRLRDRVGVEHPVLADVGCRNTVFQARAQSGASFIERFREAGLWRFRVELLNESAVDSRAVIQAYRDLLARRIAPSEVVKRLGAVSQLGVTGGTLLVQK